MLALRLYLICHLLQNLYKFAADIRLKRVEVYRSEDKDLLISCGMNFEERTVLNVNPRVFGFCCVLLSFIQAKAQKEDSPYYAFKSSLNYYRIKLKQLYFPVSCIVLGGFSNKNSSVINMTMKKNFQNLN